MKEKIIDELKDIFKQSQSWVRLEVEYLKLTAAEKFTILLSTLILGAICLLIAMVALFLLAQSCVDLFKLFMPPALASLSVFGILLILIFVIYLLRRPLLLNPIARFITRLFFENQENNK